MKILPNKPKYNLYANIISDVGPLLLRENISDHIRNKYKNNKTFIILSEYQKFKL